MISLLWETIVSPSVGEWRNRSNHQSRWCLTVLDNTGQYRSVASICIHNWYLCCGKKKKKKATKEGWAGNITFEENVPFTASERLANTALWVVEMCCCCTSVPHLSQPNSIYCSACGAIVVLRNVQQSMTRNAMLTMRNMAICDCEPVRGSTSSPRAPAECVYSNICAAHLLSLSTKQGSGRSHNELQSLSAFLFRSCAENITLWSYFMRIFV